MTFKLICTDIDGTLLDHRRELSDTTIAAFRELPGSVHVVLASSRMPSAMIHLQEQLGRLNSPLICYNGGYVIQFENGSAVPEVLHSAFINAGVCEGILRLAEGTSIHSSLYFEDNWYAPQWDHWTEREARITKVDPAIANGRDVIADWREKGVGGHKVMCMGDEKEIERMQQELQRHYSEEIHIYRSRPTYLELAPRVISKGSALELLLKNKFLIRPEEVIAFGDNYNDIDLLRFAGKGVAVANARPEVLEVADEVTLDSKADGVAVALRKYTALL